jgi:hypothetical protein
MALAVEAAELMELFHTDRPGRDMGTDATTFCSTRRMPLGPPLRCKRLAKQNAIDRRTWDPRRWVTELWRRVLR